MELVEVDDGRTSPSAQAIALWTAHSGSDRISRLYSPDMESAARGVLKSLGELKRPYLTILEENLLGVLEECGSFTE